MFSFDIYRSSLWNFLTPENPNTSHFGGKKFTWAYLLSPYLKNYKDTWRIQWGRGGGEGGQVEEFLGKDSSCLLTDRKEANLVQVVTYISLAPSWESAYIAETTAVGTRLCPALGYLILYKAVSFQTMPCPESLHFISSFYSVLRMEFDSAPRWTYEQHHLPSTTSQHTLIN